MVKYFEYTTSTLRTLQDNPWSCTFGVCLQGGSQGHTETRPPHRHPLRSTAPAESARLEESGNSQKRRSWNTKLSADSVRHVSSVDKKLLAGREVGMWLLTEAFLDPAGCKREEL